MESTSCEVSLQGQVQRMELEVAEEVTKWESQLADKERGALSRYAACLMIDEFDCGSKAFAIPCCVGMVGWLVALFLLMLDPLQSCSFSRYFVHNSIGPPR